MATTLTSQNQTYEPKSWEMPACPCCGSSVSHVFERFGYQHRYTYQKCDQCSLIYQKPRPLYDLEFTETAYEVYSSDVLEYYEHGSVTAKGQVVFDEYAYIIQEMESLVGHKGRLLEIGSNTGFFLMTAKKLGWYPVGAEISRTMVKVSIDQFQVEAHAGDWMNLQFTEGFDAIYCSHVIEHVPNPGLWIDRFRDCLKPGGIVCISVPNMNSIDRRFKRVLKRLGIKKDHWEPWRTPDHLFEPSENAMKPFFNQHGFDIVRNYTYPSRWSGKKNILHSLYHDLLRFGAKQRYYLKKKA